MTNIERIEEYLTDIESLCSQVRTELGLGSRVQIRVHTNQGEVRVRQGDRMVTTKVPSTPIVTPCNQTLELATKIINDPNWIEAVPADILCDVASDEDLIARAESLLDAIIDCDLTNLRFLDFGCGHGYVAKQALERGVKEAVGYDIERQGWERFRGTHNLSFTHEVNSLKDFDVIFVHDVLDHCQKPIEALNQIKKALKPSGMVYVRNHPWSSRTGGHLYKQINKAYIHLAIDEDILKTLGHKVEYVKKVLRPLKTYKEWFDQAGFIIQSEYQTEEIIENFFKDNIHVKNSLIRHWDLERTRDSTLTVEKVMKILQIQFIDYKILPNA